MWVEEELKVGTLSNGTVENYLGAIRCIKKHPIAERKLKTVTAEHLQAFLDLLTFGGEFPDGKVRKGYSKDYIHSFSAVLQQAFRFAVFPKQLITFNPMQYIKLKKQAEDVDLFSDDEVEEGIQPISHEDYERLIEYLKVKNPPAILPIQIAYYAGLRIGEVCGLTWQDINLEEQCLTIKRSIRYDGTKHKNIIGPTKRKKVRIVDFGDTLTEILKTARKEQLKSRMQYGELYHRNFYKEAQDKNRVYYEYYHLDGTEEIPVDYKEISFVCLRPDGCLELPSTLSIACRSVAKRLDGFENFHFHHLRHTYTSNHLPLLLCTPSKNISIRTFSIVALFSYSNVSIAVYTRTTSLCNLASKIQGSRVRSDAYEQTRRIFTLPSRKRLEEQPNQLLFLMLSISLKF